MTGHLPKLKKFCEKLASDSLRELRPSAEGVVVLVDPYTRAAEGKVLITIEIDRSVEWARNGPIELDDLFVGFHLAK